MSNQKLVLELEISCVAGSLQYCGWKFATHSKKQQMPFLAYVIANDCLNCLVTIGVQMPGVNLICVDKKKQLPCSGLFHFFIFIMIYGMFFVGTIKVYL